MRSRQGHEQSTERWFLLGGEADMRGFSPWGYDERQYTPHGFDLPVSRLTRTPYGESRSATRRVTDVGSDLCAGPGERLSLPCWRSSLRWTTASRTQVEAPRGAVAEQAQAVPVRRGPARAGARHDHALRAQPVRRPPVVARHRRTPRMVVPRPLPSPASARSTCRAGVPSHDQPVVLFVPPEPFDAVPLPQADTSGE